MVTQRTLCESNCRLVTGSIEDGKLHASRTAPLGSLVYPTVEVKGTRNLQQLAPTDGESDVESEEPRTVITNVREYAGQTAEEVKTLGAKLLTFLPWLSKQQRPGTSDPRTTPACIAWHTHQQRLAAGDATDAVHLYDLASCQQSASHADELRPPPPGDTLHHEGQAGISAMGFRPDGRGVLAVAGRVGVTLWDLEAPTSRPALTHFQELRPEGSAWIVSLAWSPGGRLLAGGHGNTPGFTVWEVAMGRPTTLSAERVPTSLLRWSPDGAYLLAAAPGGAFRLWETTHWNSAAWEAGPGGDLVGACWQPDSRCVLLAFAGARELMALHLVGIAPGLDAQLLPVDLPEFGPKTSTPGGRMISCMDWDPRGQRLAVACGPSHPSAGSVALYATSSQPVVTASYMGLVSQGAGSAPVTDVKFHGRYQRGALLAVRSGSNNIDTVPLLFAD